MKNLKFIVLLMLVAAFFILKPKLFPTPLDLARNKLIELSTLAEISNPLPPLSILKKIKGAESSIPLEIAVDISRYTNKEITQIFVKKDIVELLPLYFSKIHKIELVVQSLVQVKDKKFKLVAIARGNTAEKSFNDAYNVEVEFNDEWKLKQVSVLEAEESVTSIIK